MPTWSAGRTDRAAGITLLEMMTVVALIGILSAVLFPSFSSGLESIQLASASNALASFLNAAVNRAERRQEVVEIAVSVKENAVALHSTEAGFERKLEMPSGIAIEAVLPALPEPAEG